MVAAFGNFDIRRMLRRGDNPRRQIMIEKRRRLRGQNTQIAFDRFQDALDFAGAHDGVHLGNLLENLRSKPFD